MSITISPAQKAFYLEKGYLVLPPLTDAAELVTLRETCDHLISSGAGSSSRFPLLRELSTPSTMKRSVVRIIGRGWGFENR